MSKTILFNFILLPLGVAFFFAGLFFDRGSAGAIQMQVEITPTLPMDPSQADHGAQLHAYIRATMPIWKPGSLTEDESWRVTAFILRRNDLWNASTDLNATNAANVKIPRMAFLTPVAIPEPAQSQKGDDGLNTKK